VEEVEDLLVILSNRWPAELTAALLLVAALSFLARYWAQTRYGRIREYRLSALSVAAALAGLGVFYLFVAAETPEPAARPVVMRSLLSLLALATTAFNWGGVRIVAGDVHAAIKRGRE